MAWPGVAGVGHLDLAHGGRVAHGTGARELGPVGNTHFDVARAAVLAAEAWTRVARVLVLAVLAHVQRGTIAMRLSARVGRHTGGSILARVWRAGHESLHREWYRSCNQCEPQADGHPGFPRLHCW